jgi:hypothetical protein
MARRRMETARSSSKVEHLWRTLSYTTWHHNTIPLEFRQADMCRDGSKRGALVHRPDVNAFVLHFVYCYAFRRSGCTLHSRLCQRPVVYPTDQTFGLTMPTPTDIALVMEKKLTASSCY